MLRVEIKQIAQVTKHPNADRLVLVKLDGLDYQIIMQTGVSVGDKVIYFPIDSYLTEEQAKELNVNRRIRTIKLRGEISQGMCVPTNGPLGMDMTAIFGVTKYEPPVTFTNNCVMRPLPDGIEVYDLENAQKEPEVFKEFSLVAITEKLEGTNFVGAKNFVCSHRRLVDFGDNLYSRIHTKYELDRLPENIVIRGEIVGPSIQGNYYKLTEPELYVFDIMQDGKYLSYHDMYKFCTAYGLPIVPLIHLGHINSFLMGESVVAKSNGKSLLIDKLREGIVIKALNEIHVNGFGRLILKVRSPEYLANES